jgi:hypothetical protein
MTGTFSIHKKPAIILFNSNASYCFISAKFGAKVGLDFCHTKGSYLISTPGGKIASNQIIRHVPIKLGRKLSKPTYPFGTWRHGHYFGDELDGSARVTLDISSRAVQINSPSHRATTLYLPSWECINSCAFTMEEVKPEEILVVREYADVFLDNLPGMPLDQDIEFVIELQPGTAPIYKRPYRIVRPGATGLGTLRGLRD